MSQVTSAQNDQQDRKEKRHSLLLEKAQPKSIDLLSASHTVAKSVYCSRKRATDCIRRAKMVRQS